MDGTMEKTPEETREEIVEGTMDKSMEETVVKKIAKKEKKLACPFLWGIRDEVIQDFDLNDDYSDEDCSEGFIKLMKFITKAFILCQRGLPREAMNVIYTAEKRIWNKYDKRNLKDEKMSIDVVSHILRATKYHVYLRNGRFMEAKNLFVHIQCSSKFTYRMEQATLHGCRSIVMSFFYGDTVIETIHHAIVAKMMEPNTALWHFMLGKSLRRLRRSQQRTRPDAEEKQAFIRAEQLDSTNPEYAIYVAQMLSEDNRRTEALAKYKKIKDMLELSNSAIVKMRLVLGFMRCNKMNLAKGCLDEMDRETSTKNPMLMFYKGLYLMRKNMFEDASNCFRSAADNSQILSAYLHSLDCQNQYIENFDPAPQLLAIMHLYKKNPVNSQIILLRLGITYYRRNLLDVALGCFLQAIKLNCLGKNLRNTWEIIAGEPLTVYESVLNIWSRCQMNSEEILTVVNQNLYQNDDPMWLLKEADIKKILIFCEIVTGRRHIEKSRIIVSVGTGIQVPGMPPAKCLVRFNKDGAGNLIGADWYHYDKVYGYRRIHERRNPNPDPMAFIYRNGANENDNASNDGDNELSDNSTDGFEVGDENVDPQSENENEHSADDSAENGNQNDSISSDDYTDISDYWIDSSEVDDANFGPQSENESEHSADDCAENGSLTGNSRNNGDNERIDTSTDVSKVGDANVGPRNENESEHSADDCAENGNLTGNSRNNGDNERIDTSTDVSKIGDANVGPRNENGSEHSADDCAENGNLTGNSRNNGDNERIDTSTDVSKIGDANVGPRNENGSEHSADDGAENGSQNDSINSDRYNDFSDYWVDSSEVSDANFGPQSENESEHSADDCAENDNVTGNSRNNGDNERIDTSTDVSKVGDANVGPRNENESEHSADDCAENGNLTGNSRNNGDSERIDTSTDVSKVGDANVDPQSENENEHSADDCAENGNLTGNSRNNGDNERIDTSTDVSKIGDANVGPRNENGSEHSADDGAENGSQNDSINSDRYNDFSDYWMDSSEVSDANFGPQSDQNDNASNDGDNAPSKNSGTVHLERHAPLDLCARPICPGMNEFVVRIVKERFKVYLSNH